MKFRTLLTAFVSATLLMSATVAQTGQAEEQAALLKAMSGAKVRLQQGLDAATSRGRPISAKFELEDGKLQLSVYTDKAGKYAEVIVDHTNGHVTKVDAITEGDDLTDAKAQAGALAKVKESLKAATDKAEHDAAGYRAISALPELADKGGSAVKVTLAKGSEVKTVTVPVK
jgi:hypothetical protein